MSGPQTITLLAPLAGWSTPLDEAPDEVFATRMLGEGVAIDPTAGTLYAPCDAEVIVLPASRHAVTLRLPGGCEILLHVGLDTVALAGEGFEAHVRQGARVRAGDALLSFDLDLLARRARSVLTPVIVTADSGFRVLRQSLDRELAVGEFLMEVAPAAAANAPRAGAAAGSATHRLTVMFEHGIHARPAALLAASLKTLAADVRIAAHGREANARSPVALMALGVARGESIEIRATGPDAGAAVGALTQVLLVPAAAAPAAAAAATAPSARATPAPADGPGTSAARGAAPAGRGRRSSSAARRHSNRCRGERRVRAGHGAAAAAP